MHPQRLHNNGALATRAAQRAFRERKQSQLSELQARIQLYEQGEIERNVALQNIAKRLKEENEKLRKENTVLQEKLTEAQSGSKPSTILTSHIKKKRWRDDSPSSASLQPSQKKKSRTDPQSQHSVLSETHLPSPTSMVSSPEANDHTDTQFSVHYADPDLINRSTFETFGSISSDVKTDDVLGSFPSLGCGFCDGGAICLCHEISVEDVVERTIDTTEIKSNGYNGHVTEINQGRTDSIISQAAARTSILDNLPAYQPPIPLRRRSGGVLPNSVFPIIVVGGSSSMNTTCSGDPSNCAACGDDAFGKAFCSAIGNTVPDVCSNCPSRVTSTPIGTAGCCGAGSCSNCPSASTFTSGNAMSEPPLPNSLEYIATNDAWKKLKAHPNVDFADLSLLAEVVASRSTCMGPQLSHLNTTPDQYTNTRGPQPRSGSPRPQLVPQEILLECGRRRIRHVHADRVKDALRLLDAKFS